MDWWGNDDSYDRFYPGAIGSLKVWPVAMAPADMYTYAQAMAPADAGPTHTITASAGAGGSISPSGAISVMDGGNKTFVISRNFGYSIADVLVDGTSVGAVSSYTFTGVAADRTIAVTFVASGTAPLVDLRPTGLPEGAIASITNIGTLGGNFVAVGADPIVGAAIGKRALVFNSSPMSLFTTGGTPIAPPTAIVGAAGRPPRYTVSAWLYRDSIVETDPWSAGWLSWSVGDHCAWFQYNGGNDGWGHCVDYWGAGFGTIDYPGGAPTAGAWYHFCATCDGGSTTLWITYPGGSVLSASSGGSGYFYPDSAIFIGEIAPSQDGGRPFIGSMASLEIWDAPITVADLPTIRAFAPPTDAVTLTPYQLWLANHGNLPDTPENLQSYAFGLDLTAGASPVMVVPTPATGQFTFTRRKDTGLTFDYESSATLANWQSFTPDAPTPTVTDIDASREEVTIQIPTDLLAVPKLFVRVKVTQ